MIRRARPIWTKCTKAAFAAFASISNRPACSILPRQHDYPDVNAIASTFMSANPDRLVWGSDWPHPDAAKVEGRKPTDLAPALDIDDGRVLNLLAEWVPDPAMRQKILVDNPKRLY